MKTAEMEQQAETKAEGKASTKGRAEGKAKGKTSTKGMATGKAKGKTSTKGRATGKAKAKACSNPAKKGDKRMQEPEAAAVPSTPAKRTRTSEVEGVSPVPAGTGKGKFMNSAKRRAHEKRLEGARKCLQQLRQAGLPELRLPDSNFTRQSFTVTNGALQGCSIGVILGTSSFYVYHAWVPPELSSFAHTDRKGGVSVGWQSFHGVRLAWLGYQCFASC